MRAVHQADKCLLRAFLAYRNNLIARLQHRVAARNDELVISHNGNQQRPFGNTTSRTDLPCKAEFSSSVTEQI